AYTFAAQIGLIKLFGRGFNTISAGCQINVQYVSGPAMHSILCISVFGCEIKLGKGVMQGIVDSDTGLFIPESGCRIFFKNTPDAVFPG
ncbi:MAG: hypothetical protein MI892_03995, partial [Desulfobacterales bacterium]|nr:hypothetical protein [Desulfobacterales bacterium]